jgi:DNA-binding beta-propeller fold protein YncE
MTSSRVVQRRRTGAGVAAVVLAGAVLASGAGHAASKVPTFLLTWGEQGSGDGQLNIPHNLAVDGAGHVYVVDSSNQRIQKFTTAGVFVGKWGSGGGGEGQFQVPWSVAVDAAARHVYVVESAGRRVQKFTTDGDFIMTWGSFGSEEGEFSDPRHVAVDPATGHVYVADTGHRRIQKFTPGGVFVTKWGSEGSGEGEFGPGIRYISGTAREGQYRATAVDFGPPLTVSSGGLPRGFGPRMLRWWVRVPCRRWSSPSRR